MEMVEQQCPPVATRGGFRKDRSQSIQELIAVSIIPEYLSPFYAPADYVMERSRRIYSCLSWHSSIFTTVFPFCKAIMQ
jgi:hypothetical protein